MRKGTLTLMSMVFFTLGGCGHQGNVPSLGSGDQILMEQAAMKALQPNPQASTPSLQSQPDPQATPTQLQAGTNPSDAPIYLSSVIPVINSLLTPSSLTGGTTNSSAVQVQKIIFTPEHLNINQGDTYQISCLIELSDGSSIHSSIDNTGIKWESTNTDIVTVDADGYIKAVGSGSAYIRASYKGIKVADQMDISVSIPSGSSSCVNSLVPTGLKNKVSTTKMLLIWIPIKDATSYKVYKDGVLYAENITDKFRIQNEEKGFLIEGLCPNTAYNIQVSSVNACGESAKSDALNVTTDTSVPTGLGNNSLSTTGLGLIWTAVTGATSYNVYKDGVLYAENITDTSKALTGLCPNTAYSMQVTAVVGTCGESAKSDALSVTTNTSVPTGLDKNSLATTGFTLNWTAVTGATSYKVYKDGSLYADNITDTSKALTGLCPNTAYSMQVTAVVGTCGESAKSEALSVTTNSSVPTGLDSNNITSSSFTLTWTAVTGATGYKVYKNGSFYADSAGTSKSITGLADDTTYSMQVSAVTGTCGESTKSTALSVKTEHHHHH